MKNFPVDDDLVAMIWLKANPKPFENLTFSEALRRVLNEPNSSGQKKRKESSMPYTAQELLDELDAMSESELDEIQRKVKEKRAKRAPSPKATEWIKSVPELKSESGLHSWRDVCDHLGIALGGDSGRRKLEAWVKTNRPKWPEVPNVG